MEIVLALLLVVVFLVWSFKRSGRRARRRVFRSGGPGIPEHYSRARVNWVIDGDTVDVSNGWHKDRIRLDSIDCPEDGQPWGDTAKYGLVKLIGGKTVYLEEHGEDDYGRTLATIFVPQDGGAEVLNVNERMVALGHAWVMRRYYDHLPKNRRDSLNRIETWAKSKKVGLWKTRNPVPPWTWRASNNNR